MTGDSTQVAKRLKRDEPQQIYYLKGHCGWGVVSLVLADEIHEAEQLDTLLKILDFPISGGIDVAMIGPTDTPGDIRMRITTTHSRRWQPMCGGATQVIGKALIESQLREHFRIDISKPVVHVRLICDDSMVVPITMDVSAGKAIRITTDMDQYLEKTYSMGVRAFAIEGLPALQVGEYLMIRVQDLEAKHPGIDFTRRDFGPHLDIFSEVFTQFAPEKPAGVYDIALLYDNRPEGPGQFRVFPRFPDEATKRIPYEFHCGTGTVATAVALAHQGMLSSDSESFEFLLEWGSQHTTPDPYGIRTSQVQMTRQGKRLTSMSFSHSVNEIIVEGHVNV